MKKNHEGYTRKIVKLIKKSKTVAKCVSREWKRAVKDRDQPKRLAGCRWG